MIIKRKHKEISKLFSISTPFPSSLEEEFGNFDPELIRQYGPPIISVETDSQDYRRQYDSSPETNRKKCEEFIKQLKTDPNSRFSDINVGDNTHYLGKESKPGLPEGSRFVTFSKDINSEDRFTYKIYKPAIVTEGGKKKYIQRIVASGCLEHTISGKPGAYVKGQLGNVWHPKKNSKRKRGKNK